MRERGCGVMKSIYFRTLLESKVFDLMARDHGKTHWKH